MSHFEKLKMKFEFQNLATVKFSENLPKCVLDDFRNIDRFRFLKFDVNLIFQNLDPQ